MNLAGIDFDALRECAEMVAAVASAFDPDPVAGGAGKLAEHLRCDGFLADGFEHRHCTVGIDTGLIARCFESGNPVFQFGVIKIGNAAFDGIVKALEAQIGFGGALVQFRDMLLLALGTLLPTVKDSGKHFFQSRGVEQSLF